MKKFQRALASLGVIAAIGSVAMAAPAANADSGKKLVVVSRDATRSVAINLAHCSAKACSDGRSCHGLPGHASGAALVVGGVTLYNGDKVTVTAYNSGNCTGNSTRSTGERTVKSDNNEFRVDVR